MTQQTITEYTVRQVNRDSKNAMKAMEIRTEESVRLVHEIILTICLDCPDGVPAGRVSCTPADLKELTAGWLFTEGRICCREDIREMVYDEKTRTMHVSVKRATTGSVRNDANPFENANSCGTVGPSDNSNLPETANSSEPNQSIRDDKGRQAWSSEEILDLHRRFLEDPPLFAETRAAHSCMISRHSTDGSAQILSRSEDAGRHSAMDKAIGWALLQGIDLSDCVLFTSGRISTRMALKAAKAGVSALAGKGTVTAEAVEIARSSHMQLIGCVSEDQAVWFAGEQEPQIDQSF